MLLINAGSLVAGVLVHVRLRPPLGQLLPGVEAALAVPRAFPATFVSLHLVQLPFHDTVAGALLSIAACAMHAATFVRFRQAASRLREAAGVMAGPTALRSPWLPLSPLAGFMTYLPARLQPEPHVVVSRGIAYYPTGSSSPSARCLLDVWHCAHDERASPPRPVVLFLHGGAWNIGHRLWNADTALLHRLAAEGCVVFSAAYRFAWEARSRPAWTTASRRWRTRANTRRSTAAAARAGSC